MQHLIEFLKSTDVTQTHIFPHLKCDSQEGSILQHLLKEHLGGVEDIVVSDILSNLYGTENYTHLEYLRHIRNLLELGWIIQNTFVHLKLSDVANLELLNTSVSLSTTFFKLIEDGTLDVELPEAKPYEDHLEYLKDQFFRIELLQKIIAIKHNYTTNSPNISRIKTKLHLLEQRIAERLQVTENDINIESFFSENELNEKEQIIFLVLLKEEYSGTDDNLRDMNVLIDLVSFDDYERIKNRSLLEESARLIESGLIDYDEVITPFGGISRNFFIPEEILHKIMHPQKKKKRQKMKLDMLIKEQDIFEFIEPKAGLDSVVLHPKTRETLDNVLKQMDSRVVGLLRDWGIKDKKKGVDAKIILYGPPGTGKTMTAVSLAKSLKKQVLSFDCSKILSMYVGESEKNVRKIFDTYKELTEKVRNEPVLLLNEADQFLSSRTTDANSSADKMHNQMQNIFLEQIERFDGVLIATTNLLETIDMAFSRRFSHKIEFKKPNQQQRIELWNLMLPENAPYTKDFNIDKLAEFNLTGGQIHLVIRNAALRVAGKDEAVFGTEDFIVEIERERSGNFDSEKSMGFLS